MTDPIMAFLGGYLMGKAADAALTVARDLAAASPNPFEAIRQRMGGEAGFEMDLAFKRHVTLQEARDSEFKEKLREKVTEREVCALFPRLLLAAAEASTRERMRMLCGALAGLMRPDINAEMRSRVSRAVTQLEASDVLVLRRLADRANGAGIRQAQLMTPELEPLALCGCITDHSGRIGGTVEVAALGQAVLAALEAWAPEDS